MILNELEYKVTVEWVEKFRCQLESLSKLLPGNGDIDPQRLQSSKNAVSGQLKMLESEVEEYERFRNSADAKISFNSPLDIGKNLVRARIKSQISQEGIAARLGIPESEFKRLERSFFDEYNIIQLDRVAKALNVQIPTDVLPLDFSGDLKSLLLRLKEVGINKDFVLKRLLLTRDGAKLQEKSYNCEDMITLKLCSIIERVYGWSYKVLFNGKPLTVSNLGTSIARFRILNNRTNVETQSFSTYANYLAEVVAKAMRKEPLQTIPNNPLQVRNEIISNYGEIDFEKTLHYVWDRGIAVVPLDFNGNFLGACWRLNGRNVIVLNQGIGQTARWLFVLLHEVYHAGQFPTKKSFDKQKVNTTSTKKVDYLDEKKADEFAELVMFGENASTLIESIGNQFRGDYNELSKLIERVASENEVNVIALTNSVICRLQSKSNEYDKSLLKVLDKLQPKTSFEPHTIASDIFLNRFTFQGESEIDLQLLNQAIQFNFDGMFETYINAVNERIGY